MSPVSILYDVGEQLVWTFARGHTPKWANEAVCPRVIGNSYNRYSSSLTRNNFTG